MSPALAARIIEFAHDGNKDLYRTVLGTVAQARNLRPAFFERTPRPARHATMAAMLAKPRLELMAANLLRDWLMKGQTPMLADFMDALGIAHKDAFYTMNEIHWANLESMLKTDSRLQFGG